MKGERREERGERRKSVKGIVSLVLDIDKYCDGFVQS
jgi:hypothetical protein